MRLPRKIVQEEKNPRLHPGQLQHTRTAQQERLGGNRQSVGKSWGGAGARAPPGGGSQGVKWKHGSKITLGNCKFRVNVREEVKEQVELLLRGASRA